VRFELNQDGARVLEADNCQALDVIAPHARRDEIGDRLLRAGLGRWHDSGTVALSVGRLHDLASSAEVGPDWPERWRSMLTYAASKGWLDEDTDEVLAHVVSLTG
jgi:hypothetical protein